VNVPPSSVVVPYADFLERRERRLRVASELASHDTRGAGEPTHSTVDTVPESGEANQQPSSDRLPGDAVAEPSVSSTPVLGRTVVQRESP
jgi:hypothetical protein